MRNNISFTGMLSVRDDNCSRILNTKQIVKAEENKDKQSVTVTMTKGEPFRLGYTFAELEKAIIRADKKGFYSLGSNDEEATRIREQNGENPVNQMSLDMADDVAHADVNVIEDKNTSDSSDVANYNVFDYVSKELVEKRGQGKVCPNSLSNVNYCYRNDSQYLLTAVDHELVDEVDMGFERINGLQKEMVFYRAVSGNDLPDSVMNANVGDVIIPDKGYAQVTPDKTMLSKYVPAKSLDPVVFVIKCPKGSKVCIVPGELTGSGYQEGMMQGSAQYRVLSKEKTNFSWEHYDMFSGQSMKKTMPVTQFVLELI